MKKYLLPIVALALAVTSCDFLDTTPQSKLTPENYFRNENDMKLFSNSFYSSLFANTPYDDQSDLNFTKGSLSDELMGYTRIVPSATGISGWNWKVLRKINTMLGNMDKCSDEAVVKEYTALAKFFRAKFYFEKVKQFGDVPWYDKEPGSTDEDLYKPRDSRELVMSNMLVDIDEAIEGLPAGVSTYRVNKWAAYMLKAQFCLFEGTYRKYHGISYTDGRSADDYLRLAYEAAEKVMTCGLYKLAPDYGLLFSEEDADQGEFILAVKFDQSIGRYHNGTQYAIERGAGMSKKFVDSFLMKDGSRFSDKEGWERMSFVDEMKDRDPRLGKIVRLPSYVRVISNRGTSSGPNLKEGTSTGYQIDKYVMDQSIPTAERASMSYNDLPVYRLAEAYLIFAEAKAELNVLTQDDVDRSINLLRDRVGMPHLKLDGLTVDPFLVSDDYGYLNLRQVNPSNLAQILEVRRERTIELCLEFSSRWDDIRRWKEGQCFAQPLRGIYFPAPGAYDLTGDGVPDVYLYASSRVDAAAQKEMEKYGKDHVAFFQIQEIEIDGKYVAYSDGIVLSEGDHGFMEYFHKFNRVFDENRDYLYPIPVGDRQLNMNLAQNPGWNDGLNSGGNTGDDTDDGNN